MRSNYKPIGKYVNLVEERNKELQNLPLIGLSITKQFIPSIANTIGTDMSTYRTIYKNQFAYSAVTSRNGDKLTIALFKDLEKGLISQAYTPFEVTDTSELLPEYLMMWFSRPDFDRYARFKSHGSARELFSWEDLCESLMPIPSITKQKEIVAEYNTIQSRITLNKQLIKKLEETAQASYKSWFVDFEFPDENGKPYKSSGGEMVESELGEIPKGWEVNNISSFCQITSSKRIFESDYKTKGVPFYRAGEIKQKKEGVSVTDLIYISEEKFLKISKLFGHPLAGDILLTAVGSLLGDSYLVEDETFYFKDGNVVWLRNFTSEGCNFYLYDYLQSEDFSELLNEIKIGSGQSAITIKGLNEKKIIKPSNSVLKKYKKMSSLINNSIAQKKKQNASLEELKSLLLSKLATIQN